MLKRGAIRTARLGARFTACRRAIAAVEFALVLPVLVLMLGGAVELGGAITAGNRATFVAETVGQLLSQSQRPVTSEELTGFIKSAALVDPDIVAYAKATGKALDQAVHVAVASVVFSPKIPTCKADCQYDASVVFSKSLAGPKRACGRLSSGPGSMASLPAGAFSPSSLIVTDVEVFYRPLMTSILGDTISFKRSTYFPPRRVERVDSDSNCPGFPLG